MKHLKTFEQLNNQEGINEDIWGSVNKWATGYENKGEKEEKKNAILDQLNAIEDKVKQDPDKWVFNRAKLEKSAEENNYRGELRTQRGGRDRDRVYVVWDNKASGIQNIAKAASNSTNRIEESKKDTPKRSNRRPNRRPNRK